VLGKGAFGKVVMA